MNSSSSLPYPLHVAIWCHDIEAVRTILQQTEETEQDKLSTIVNEQGPLTNGEAPILTALRLGHLDIVRMLLDTNRIDFSKIERTREGWRALMLALPFLRSYPQLTLRLVESFSYQAENKLFERLYALQNSLTTIPDFTMKIKFYFTTWVPIIGRLFPNDECIIRKIKDKGLRIDFSLAGFNSKSFSWRKGGKLSLLLTLPDKPGPLSYTALNAAYDTNILPDPTKQRYEDYIRYTPNTPRNVNQTTTSSSSNSNNTTNEHHHPCTGRIYVLDHVQKRWAELSLPEIIERKLRRKDHFGLLSVGKTMNNSHTAVVPTNTTVFSSASTTTTDNILHASTLEDELDLEHSALHLISAGWPHVQSWSQNYPTITQEMKEKGFFRRMFNFGRHSFVQPDQSIVSYSSSSTSPIPPRTGPRKTGFTSSPLPEASTLQQSSPAEDNEIYEYANRSPREQEIKIHEQAIQIGSPRSTTGKLMHPHQEPVTERIGNFVGCVFKMSDIVVAVEARPPLVKGAVETWERNHRQQLFGTHGTVPTTITRNGSSSIPTSDGTTSSIISSTVTSVPPPPLPLAVAPVSPGSSEAMGSGTLNMPGTLFSKLRPSKQTQGSLANTLITHMFHATPTKTDPLPTVAKTAEGTPFDPAATLLMNTTNPVLNDSITIPIETYADNTILIGARQIEKYTVPVRSNDTVEWNIQLILVYNTKHEMNFSIDFTPSSTTTTSTVDTTEQRIILPIQRITQSQGSWKSTVEGTVTFNLDNRTSFWYSKNVQIHILKHHQTTQGLPIHETLSTTTATENNANKNILFHSSSNSNLVPPSSNDHYDTNNDIDQERKDLIHLLAHLSDTSISSSSSFIGLSATTKTKYRDHPLRSVIFPTCNIVSVPFSTYFGVDSHEVQQMYGISSTLLPDNDAKEMITPPVPQFLTRTLEAKIVGTPTFPLTVQQILPIIEAIASNQGHMNDIRYFLTNLWPSHAGFPVAFDMPIMHALGVHFRWELLSMDLHSSTTGGTNTTTTTTETETTINYASPLDASLLDIPDDYTDATVLLIQELFFEQAGTV